MTIEIIFAVIQVVATEVVAVLFKDSVIPKRFIPLVNLGIGIIVAVCAVCLGLYDDMLTAIIISLGLAFAVGGAYDMVQTVNHNFIDKK